MQKKKQKTENKTKPAAPPATETILPGSFQAHQENKHSEREGINTDSFTQIQPSEETCMYTGSVQRSARVFFFSKEKYVAKYDDLNKNGPIGSDV